MSTEHDTALALVPAAPAGGMVLPVATIEDGRAAIAAFERAKSSILLPRDVVKISGREHIKRSGWDRIARFFGVSVYPVSEEYQTDPDGTWGYAVVVKAVAPNGAMMIGDGMCWSSEKAQAQRTRHNVRAHAYTRATNRAISNLVGGGEVSAEELSDYVDSYVDATPVAAQPQRQAPAQPRTSAKPTPKPASNGALNWGALRKEALDHNIKTIDQWEAALVRVTGTTDTRALTAEHYAAVRKYILTGELPEPHGETVDAEYTVADADDAYRAANGASDGHDLHELGTVRG